MKPRALRPHSRPAFLLTQVEDEEGRTHLLIHLAIEEQHEHRWCLWRPDQAGFDSKSIFEAALVKKKRLFLKVNTLAALLPAASKHRSILFPAVTKTQFRIAEKHIYR